MIEELIPAAAVLARVHRAGLAAQFDTQRYIGGWVSEIVIGRVIFRRGATIRDCVYFTPVGDEHAEFLWAGEAPPTLVGREIVVIESHLGPLVLIDRRIEDPEVDVAVWISNALAHTSLEGIKKDTLPRTDMREGLFWDYIALLNGRLDEAAVTVLADELAKLTRRRQLGFQQVFDRKLFELDHPRNTVGSDSDPSEPDYERSLMYRCEILVRGEEEFAARVADPRPGTSDDGRSSPEILYVLEEASGRPMPVKTYPISTASNPAHWPDAPPAPTGYEPPATERPSPGPFSQRVQLNALGLSTSPTGRLHGFVGYIVGESYVREVIGCVMAMTVQAAREEAELALAERLLPGEGLHRRVLVATTGAGSPTWGVSLVELVTRTDQSVREYISDRKLTVM